MKDCCLLVLSNETIMSLYGTDRFKSSNQERYHQKEKED
jgi:hypothetical protein